MLVSEWKCLRVVGSRARERHAPRGGEADGAKDGGSRDSHEREVDAVRDIAQPLLLPLLVVACAAGMGIIGTWPDWLWRRGARHCGALWTSEAQRAAAGGGGRWRVARAGESACADCRLAGGPSTAVFTAFHRLEEPDADHDGGGAAAQHADLHPPVVVVVDVGRRGNAAC